jgi:hypothetical protein
VFEKLLPGPSQIVCVTLPRPLGVVFEFDERRKRASVAGFVEGSNAEQRQKVSRCLAAGTEAYRAGNLLDLRLVSSRLTVKIQVRATSMSNNHCTSTCFPGWRADLNMRRGAAGVPLLRTAGGAAE